MFQDALYLISFVLNVYLHAKHARSISSINRGFPVNGIVESRLGYRDNNFYVMVLFYADLLLQARSCEEAEEMVQMVVVP